MSEQKPVYIQYIGSVWFISIADCGKKVLLVRMVAEGDIDVVISGIGGKFPEKNNVEELKNALMEQVALMNAARWKEGIQL